MFHARPVHTKSGGSYYWRANGGTRRGLLNTPCPFEKKTQKQEFTKPSRAVSPTFFGHGHSNRSPHLGVGRRGSPQFVLISPFSSDLRSLFSGMPQFVPICSDLFSKHMRTNQGTRFCRPLLQVPDLRMVPE